MGNVQPVGYLDKLGYLFGSWVLVNTVNERNVMLPCGLCGGFIGHKHKFLDDKLGFSPFSAGNSHAYLVCVYFKLAFGRVYLGSTPFELVCGENFRKLLHKEDSVKKSVVFFPDVIGESGHIVLAVKDLVYLAVNALDTGADNGLAEFVFKELSLAVKLHKAGKCKPVLIGVKGAYAV